MPYAKLTLRVTVAISVISQLGVTLFAERPRSAPVRYGADQCGVSVESPAELKHTRRAVAQGTATTHLYTAETRGTTFTLYRVRDPEIPGPADPLFDTYRDGLLDDDPKQLVAEKAIALGAVAAARFKASNRMGRKARYTCT